MARFNTTLPSPHPPEVVFDAMVNFANTAIWDPNVESGERLDDGPIQVGSTFRLINNFFGQKQRLKYEVTEYNRPDQFVVIARTKAFDSIDTITVVATAAGSELTYDAVVKLTSKLAPVLDPVLGLLFKIVAGKAGKGLGDFITSHDLAERAAG